MCTGALVRVHDVTAAFLCNNIVGFGHSSLTTVSYAYVNHGSTTKIFFPKR